MTNVAAVTFGLTAITYLLSAAAHFADFYMRRWQKPARLLAWTAWGFHTIALAARVVETGRPPLFALYDTALFFSWVIVLHYLVVELVLKVRVVGTFLIPMVFLFLMYALSQPRTVVAGEQVEHVFVAVHVVVALLGYGAFALAFIAGIMYLMQERQLRTKSFSLLYQRLPSLESLDRMSHQFVVFGYPLLTLAIFTGSLWANQAWGRYWGWEAKETWTLFTWLIYSAYLTLRYWGQWRGRRAAWLAVAGFTAVLVNYFVVSAVLSDLHNF